MKEMQTSFNFESEIRKEVDDLKRRLSLLEGKSMLKTANGKYEAAKQHIFSLKTDKIRMDIALKTFYPDITKSRSYAKELVKMFQGDGLLKPIVIKGIQYFKIEKC